MSIYRGAGGAGDAVNDSSSEATLVAQLATEAQVDADAAAASAAAAAGSASTASTQATNASNSATAASTSASGASTSATNAAASASSATSSASTATTQATNASTSASTATTQAGIATTKASEASTSATNAATSASGASTSATNASNSASAASTSATNAASSATSASGSASTATTQASNASTSATNAAASATSASGSASTATTQAGIATTKAGEASTSATNAASSASGASTSATNAATSASAASTSATNASSSASAASTSATNAAASYDSFDDRYLGAKSTAPTLDNDGNALLTGALYFNTVSSSMKVYNGSAWLDAYASLSGALIATNNLSDLNNTATARTNLGVAIGTNVQAWDGDLDAIAALAGTSGLLKKTAANTWSLDTTAYTTNTGTVTSVAATVPSFLSVSGSPITTSGTLALTYSGTALPLANGGTGATSAPAALTNLRGWTTTATAAGTTTLTNTSTTQQEFTGATTQTVVLPVTSTLALGWAFEIINNSTGSLTIQSSGLNTIATLTAGTTASVICVLTSGTTAASWDFDIDGFATETGTGSVVRATSPTLVTPALGTPVSGTLTNCTFPTLNQNTTGTAAGLSTTLVATSGGTGQSTYAVGDLLVGGATNTLTKLADVATGNALISGGVGVAPSYGKIGLTTHVSGTLPIANGGTNATSAPAAMASLMGFTTTATAAGTTTLTNTSSYYQIFTGATTQTITLPVTSTLLQGWSYHIVNNSTGNLTVNSSGSNLVITVLPGTTAMVTCILTSGTTAASWDFEYVGFGTLTGTGANVLATSPTLSSPVLTTPSISNIDAKGDILVGTANDTLGVLTAGSNGDTLVADSSTSTGLRYQSNFAAGKNAMINGAFNVWQRGTTFTSPANGAYTADRFKYAKDGTGTATVSQQAFTAGTAPVSGYESQYFLRCASTAAGTSTFMQMSQPIEDVRTFAGQTITLSFWAKSDTARSSFIYAEQNFGSGGSATVQYLSMGSASTTTSWQRFTFTVALTSIAGKTVGTSSYLEFFIRLGAVASGATLDIWGVQVEAGSVATAFQTATGTLQGELAACQRYFYRSALAVGGTFSVLNGSGFAYSTTGTVTFWKFPTSMRVAPTAVTVSGAIRLVDGVTAYTTGTWAISAGDCSNEVGWLTYTHGSAALTQFRPYYVSQNADANAFVGWTAEL